MIEIIHPHEPPRENAMAKAERIARKMRERYGVQYHWDGDTLHFRHTMAQGRIEIEELETRVLMELGWLLLPFRNQVESEIRQYLDDSRD